MQIKQCQSEGLNYNNDCKINWNDGEFIFKNPKVLFLVNWSRLYNIENKYLLINSQALPKECV